MRWRRDPDGSLLPGAPPRPRPNPNDLGKYAREMALISEPACGRDLRERQSRGYQEPLRVFDASLQEPAVSSPPRRPLEGTSEMSNGQTAGTREVSQSDCFIEALPQDLLG